MLTVSDTQSFYVCSLSSRTIVYKGQLSPEQVSESSLPIHLPTNRHFFRYVASFTDGPGIQIGLQAGHFSTHPAMCVDQCFERCVWLILGCCEAFLLLLYFRVGSATVVYRMRAGSLLGLLPWFLSSSPRHHCCHSCVGTYRYVCM